MYTAVMLLAIVVVVAVNILAASTTAATFRSTPTLTSNAYSTAKPYVELPKQDVALSDGPNGGADGTDSTSTADDSVIPGAFDIHQPWQEPANAASDASAYARSTDVVPCLLVLTPPMASTVNANDLAMVRFTDAPCRTAFDNGTSRGYDISLFNSPRLIDNHPPATVTWDFALSLGTAVDAAVVNKTGGWLWHIPLITADQGSRVGNWSDWYIRVDEKWQFAQSSAASNGAPVSDVKMVDSYGMTGPFTLTRNSTAGNSTRVLFMEPLRTEVSSDTNGPTNSSVGSEGGKTPHSGGVSPVIGNPLIISLILALVIHIAI